MLTEKHRFRTIPNSPHAIASVTAPGGASSDDRMEHLAPVKMLLTTQLRPKLLRRLITAGAPNRLNTMSWAIVERMRLAFGASIAAAFLVANMFTAERSPTVSMDEVWFAEPATNLADGRGFTTSAWDTQDRHEFWAGNAPLYSLLLREWLRVAPLTPLGVRSLNYFITLLAVFLVWFGSRRFHLINQGSSEMLLVVILLCSYSISFSYRSGRYDCLALLLFSMVFAAASLEWLPGRYAGTVGGAAFIAPAGFQLIAFAAILGALLLLWYGRAAIPYVAVFAAGIIVGVIHLYLLYETHGVWDAFLSTISRHSVVTIGEAPTSPWNQLGSKWLQIPISLIVDPVNGFLVLVTGGIAYLHRSALHAPVRKMILFSLSAAVALPVLIELLYTYRIYYGWVVVVPLTISLLALRDNLDGASAWGPPFRRLAVTAIGVAIVVGLPARLTVTLLEWSARDYAPVEELVERNVTSRDWVFADFQAYYPVKRIAAVTFLPPYERVMPADDRARVTVLILGKASFKHRHVFPGEWIKTDELASPADAGIFGLRRAHGARPYELVVLRRRI